MRAAEKRRKAEEAAAEEAASQDWEPRDDYTLFALVTTLGETSRVLEAVAETMRMSVTTIRARLKRLKGDARRETEETVRGRDARGDVRTRGGGCSVRRHSRRRVPCRRRVCGGARSRGRWRRPRRGARRARARPETRPRGLRRGPGRRPGRARDGDGDGVGDRPSLQPERRAETRRVRLGARARRDVEPHRLALPGALGVRPRGEARGSGRSGDFRIRAVAARTKFRSVRRRRYRRGPGLVQDAVLRAVPRV